jgi:hypothetical protein
LKIKSFHLSFFNHDDNPLRFQGKSAGGKKSYDFIPHSLKFDF